MIVVDAGVLVAVLLGVSVKGGDAAARIAAEAAVAPELIDLEVVSVLRRLVASSGLSSTRATHAVDDLRRLPIDRAPHGPLIPRIWELRENVTPYDAAYVALAEALGVTLLTGDRRLAKAPGPRCRIELVTLTS